MIDIDKDKYLSFLWRTGNFWNPANQDTLNVTQDDLKNLTLTHQLVQQATQSWQLMDANFDALSFIFHLRSIIADGDIGPATAAMVEVPRCPMPDHPPPPGALFDYGDEGLNGAVRSYAEYVGGSGSWPKGCDPDYPNVHSTRVNLDTSSASTHQKQILPDSLKYVEACEAEFGQHVRHILDGDKDKAETDVRFQYIAGGVIGYCYFPKPNTCNQTITCRIDNSFNPGALTFANLLTHEYKGHGDGLEHTRGGIMNPSIITINPLSWKGDKHEGTKRRYFGGVPLPSTPVPPTDPPPPTGDFNGIFTYGGKLLKIKVFE